MTTLEDYNSQVDRQINLIRNRPDVRGGLKSLQKKQIELMNLQNLKQTLADYEKSNLETPVYQPTPTAQETPQQRVNRIALNILSSKKQRFGDEFYTLNGKEKNQVRNIVEEYQSAAERNSGRLLLDSLKQQLGVKDVIISREAQEKILREAAVSGGLVNVNVQTREPQRVLFRTSTESDIQNYLPRTTQDVFNRLTTPKTPQYIDTANLSLKQQLGIIGKNINTRLKTGDLPSILNRDIPNAVNMVSGFGSKTLRNKAITAGIAAPDSLFSVLADPESAPSQFTNKYISSGDIALSTFFAPAFASGSSATSEYVFDYKKQRFVKKADVEAFGDLLRSGVREIKDTSNPFSKTVDLREITRSLIERNKNSPANLKKLLQFYKDAGRETLFKDILSQEGFNSAVSGGIPAARPPKPKIQIAGAPPVNLPFASQGLSAASKQSAFYGQGLYERTNEVTTFKQRNKPAYTSLSNELNRTQTKTNNLVYGYTSPFFKTDTKLNQQNRVDNRERQDQPSRLGQPQTFFNPQNFGQNTQQRTRTDTTATPTVTTGLTPKPRPPRTPTRPITPFFKLPRRTRQEKKYSSPIFEPSLFFAETRRFGKTKIIGQGSNFKDVFRRGLASTRGSLAARLKIRQGSKYLSLEAPNDFYRSKKDPLAIIQRRGARLSSIGERSEIKAARRGIKWF